MTDQNDARDRILESTIRLIGIKGTMDVSVREIAREAEVNVAAINYYFETKERMLAQMQEHFLGRYARVDRLLFDDSLEVEQRLRRWADEVMHYLLRFPGILVLVSKMVSSELPDAFERQVRVSIEASLAEVERLMGELIGTDDSALLTFRAALLHAAITHPITHQETAIYSREQLEDAGFRQRYLDQLFVSLKA